MTEINNLTEAFIELFGLSLLGARPILPETRLTEQGLLPHDCYHQLQSIDGIPDNPLAYTDIREFLNREGLQGLKRFYPHYNFRFDPESKKIAVMIEYPALTTVIPSSDQEVGKILKYGGLPRDFAKRLDVNISAREYVAGTPILLVLQDEHGSSRHNYLLWDLANQLLETVEGLTLFYESVSGSIDFTPVIGEHWSALQKHDPLYQGWSFSELADFLTSNSLMRNFLISKDPLLPLYAYHSERLHVLNPESPFPLFPDILEWGADLLVEENPEIKQGEAALQKMNSSLYGMRLMGGDPSQMYLTAGFQEHDADYRAAIDQRTKRWARNILTYAHEQQNTEPPPVYVLVGGRGHMPKLAEELKGKITTLFLAPRTIL